MAFEDRVTPHRGQDTQPREEVGPIEVVDYGVLDIGLFGAESEDLNEDLEKQAALYAFWGVREADAELLAAGSKHDLDIVRAEVWKQKKRELNSDDSFVGRVTDQDIQAAVECDSRVKEARRQYITDEHRLKQYKAIRFALSQKKDMLSSRVGKLRTEMDFYVNQARIDMAGSHINPKTGKRFDNR